MASRRPIGIARGLALLLGGAAAFAGGNACNGKTTRDSGVTSQTGTPGDTTGGSGGATGGSGGGGGSRNEGGISGGGSGGSGDGGYVADGGEGGGLTTAECVVATRLDACCQVEVAVSRDEVEGDECLVPLFDTPVTPEVVARCIPDCPLPGDCPLEPVPGLTRVAALGADGQCVFADECQVAEDCEWAVDAMSDCCPCKRSLPTELIAAGRCLSTTEVAEGCQSCPGPCVACAEPTILPTCESQTDGPNRCGPDLPLVTVGQCTEEFSCNEMYVSCFEPGESACGGPAPPRPECATDADCGQTGVICEPRGHCGSMICMPGCSEGGCEDGQVCGPDYRCAGAACAADGDCGGDFECSPEGVCERRVCTSSASCGGFCVRGLCYPEAGTCQATNLP